MRGTAVSADERELLRVLWAQGQKYPVLVEKMGRPKGTLAGLVVKMGLPRRAVGAPRRVKHTSDRA